MKPDPEMAAREKKAEEDSLAATKAGMSEAQLQGIIDATASLKAAQVSRLCSNLTPPLPRTQP